ncbi:unnamed protein product [Protopolystoma xenopodis]|uniref:Uncharacterized protein n=1 Tax=Protopolystoma xenopodis TaxID=117903 RepID=A0A448WVD1_9PLAT|nr:unnamed protein product [Protopolystoma xenopodis]
MNTHISRLSNSSVNRRNRESGNNSAGQVVANRCSPPARQSRPVNSNGTFSQFSHKTHLSEVPRRPSAAHDCS